MAPPSLATRSATTTLPPAPTQAAAGLTATAGNNRVALAWSAVTGATSYQVFRTSTGTWDVTPLATTSKVTFTDWTAINGTTYAYLVRAANKGGVGPASVVVSGTPLAAPTGVTAQRGDTQVTVSWQAVPGAASYTLYRSTTWTNESFAEAATGITAPTFVDTGLINGTKYYYRVRAVAPFGISSQSSTVSATPQIPPPAAAPTNVVATPGNARVTLAWDPVPAATSYKIYRAVDGVWEASGVGSTTTTTWKNYSLINGSTYSYKVTARNVGGEGPPSQVVSATPTAPPPAPTGVTAAAGNGEVTVTWAPTPGATAYNVYRGTASNRQSRTAVATGLTTPTFLDKPVQNGPTYFYKVTATNPGGESPKSDEVSASPEAPAPTPDPTTIAAYRLLRQATWGPKPGEVEALKTMGYAAFLDEQLAAPPSTFPDTLLALPVEAAQEHFMHLALTGPDQLRQRVAWALHKIWVVSAVEVGDPTAIVTYYRILLDGAFGNYRDLMEAMTLNPAMGRYLNMLNNVSEQVTGVAPNENYAREVMQLFVLGLTQLNPDGSARVDGFGQPLSTYTEADVKELARILTGWTYGDGDPARVPTRIRTRERFQFPMEVVEANHDHGAKTLLGQQFMAGQTAQQDLEQALDLLFNHPNVAPFVSRQLIQQLVTSNPSAGYVQAVAAVFANNGSGVRGDLGAVVRAILLHPEAGLSTDNTGKLSEPVLYVISQLRALNATVTDHPFMSDKSEEMGQKVFYPPSVFSYFSPGYRVRGTTGPGGAPLQGPEFQILTSVTALERANFTGALVAGWYGDNVRIDYTPLTSLAADPAALVDAVNLLFMGGRMSADQRREIIAAVRVSPASSPMERVRTALYLTIVAAQAQVDR